MDGNQSTDTGQISEGLHRDKTESDKNEQKQRNHKTDKVMTDNTSDDQDFQQVKQRKPNSRHLNKMDFNIETKNKYHSLSDTDTDNEGNRTDKQEKSSKKLSKKDPKKTATETPRRQQKDKGQKKRRPRRFENRQTDIHDAYHNRQDCRL